MVRTLLKTSLREIRQSLGRYLAILAIVGLGVGFFAGLRTCQPAMVKTGTDYYDEYHMFDYQLLSTLGFTEEDVEAFAAIEGVAAARGAVYTDFLTEIRDGEEAVVKAHSLTADINLPNLTAGRMPQAPNECLADALRFREEDIGRTLPVSDSNDEDTKELLQCGEYTIVGLCRSPYYLNNERGTSSLGSGSVFAFVYIPEEGFHFEAYYEVYLALENPAESYSGAYKDQISALKSTVEQQTSSRAELRYTTLYNDAMEEIQDAEGEVAEGWETYRSERADTEEELNDAYQELTDGEAEYKEGLADYEQGLRDYASGLQEYEDGLAELTDAKEELDRAGAELADAKAELDGAEAEFADSKAKLDSAKAELNEGEAAYNAGYQQLSETAESMGITVEQLAALSPEAAASWEQLKAAKAQLDQGRMEYEAGLAAYEAGRRNFQQGLDQYNESFAAYQQGLRDYEVGLREMEDAKAELDSAKSELDRVPAELADARRELDGGWAEYNDGRADADREFADAERELTDAEAELADARKELADLKRAVTYVLTREENTGYVCFDNDTSIIAAISVVFPAFFFLVAALVCMTTMTRMVDEQRTQIGVLKALGYGNIQIMGKYLFYSGSAALIGSGLGYALGSTGLPLIIWEIYGIIYGFAPLEHAVLPGLITVSFAAALLCSMGATWLSCRVELAKQSAELLRPKTPRAGRRVFLEYITPLWRRLSFLYKVSARNVLRYRSRLIMMVLGIGGCTALLATGFGIRDSIGHVADDQYGEITLYDYAVNFQEEQTRESASAYLERRGWEPEEGLLVHSGSVDVLAEGGSRSVYQIVSSTGSLEGYIDLHSGKTPVSYPGPGEVVINAGLAKNLDIAVGDTLRLRDGELGELEVTVSGISDNYVFHYAYVAAETYQEQLGQTPEYNSLYLHSRGGPDPYAEGAVLLEDKDAGSVTVIQASREQVNNMLSRLDYVVVVVVACAAALAFIVLFNLTNINITERIREIATIKVLGFYQNEVASYVFREIMILSALGSLAGLLMGKALHAYVMAQVQIDSMFFACRISLLSYAVSFLMTMLFTVGISMGMRPRLRRIDMAESLKSIE